MATSSSAPAARSWNRRRVLIALAVALAIGEFIGALSIDWPAGILFIAGAYWIRRGGVGGPILVGLLAAIEAVAVPFHGPYADWAQDRWIVQMLFVLVSLAGLITAIAILVASKRSPRSLSRAGSDQIVSTDGPRRGEILGADDRDRWQERLDRQQRLGDCR